MVVHQVQEHKHVVLWCTVILKHPNFKNITMRIQLLWSDTWDLEEHGMDLKPEHGSHGLMKKVLISIVNTLFQRILVVSLDLISLWTAWQAVNSTTNWLSRWLNLSRSILKISMLKSTHVHGKVVPIEYTID
jgi:hypothetical protein